MNRVEESDLASRLPEERWTGAHDTVQRQRTRPSQRKERQEGKVVVWGGFTSSQGKERSEKQGRKGNTFSSAPPPSSPFIYVCVLNHSVVSDPATLIDCRPLGSSIHGVVQTRTLELNCHFLLQGTFPIEALNQHLLCLLHWQVNSLSLSQLGSPSLSFMPQTKR